MIERGLATVARVHAVDWRAAGLDFLVPPGTTPGLDVQLDAVGASTTGPSCATGCTRSPTARSRGCAPSGRGAATVGLCWGDPRPGNIIWRDAAPVCVTDFEAASIAPPELDLGWWLMFDRTMHEWAGIERVPRATRRRDEQLRMYEAASGRVGARCPVVRDLRGGALLRDRRAGHEPGRRPRRSCPRTTRSGSRTRRVTALEALLAET